MRSRLVLLLMLAAVLGAANCSDIDDSSEVPLESIIVLSRVDETTLRADGLSSTTIRAQIPPDATTKTVTFRVTGATIRGGTSNGTELAMQADTQGRAEVTLVAGSTSGVAVVTATISNFVRTLDVPIAPAYPDALNGETDRVTVARDGTAKATISIFATRSRGAVSTNIPIAFSAEQKGTDGVVRTVGRFTGVDGAKTSSAGKATIVFAADTGDVNTTEPIVIRAATVNDQGLPVTFSLQLLAQ